MEMRVPPGIFAYLKGRADYVLQVFARLSPKQQAKIAKLTAERAEDIASSEAFRAFLFDLELSGSAAIRQPADADSKERLPGDGEK
jgi:hypothetical protein